MKTETDKHNDRESNIIENICLVITDGREELITDQLRRKVEAIVTGKETCSDDVGAAGSTRIL